MQDEKSGEVVLVPSEKVAVPKHPEISPLLENTNWWEPDFDALVTAMRDVLNGRKAHKSPREHVAIPRSWSNACDVLVAHMQRVADERAK